jgi:chaperone required for assembly of F1-ATPase
MKRFYKQAEACAALGGGFEIHLDGRPVRLPESKQPLRVDNQALAQAIAAEWDAQEAEIRPDSMVLMQITSTCLDKVSVQRAAMHAQLLNYVDTDLLFYRADKPETLLQLQEAAWNPALDQFEQLYGLRPLVTQDLVALRQPQALHDQLDAALAALDDPAFTVLQIAVPLSGSLITGLLFTLGHLTPEAVLQICRVEERYKDTLYDAQKYGQDPSIEKADQAALRDLQACRFYLDLLTAE